MSYSLRVNISGAGMLVIILAAVSVVLVNKMIVEPTVRSHAEGYARNYARRFRNWSSPVVICSSVTTDGYVPCTINNPGGQAPEQIECPSNFVFTADRRCREYRITR